MSAIARRPTRPTFLRCPRRAGGRVTFGCFNNLAKVTPDVLRAWGRILEAAPHSRLVLRTHALDDPGVREALLRRLRGLGLPLGRVELAGSLPHRELLRAYNDIDIALDPFPYTGGLTVCEALWMGVPVLSLGGDSFCGRHALSHLSNVGLPDWAVGTEEDYVREAVRRAADTEALAELRAGLRARVGASPLCDAPRFGASLAEALRAAWHGWCAGQEAAAAGRPARVPAPA
jgi:protein O-GlcNAc transferase